LHGRGHGQCETEYNAEAPHNEPRKPMLTGFVSCRVAGCYRAIFTARLVTGCPSSNKVT
jgi:hypothetical protein